MWTEKTTKAEKFAWGVIVVLVLLTLTGLGLLLSSSSGSRLNREISMADNLHLTTKYESPANHPELAIRIASDWAVNGLGVPEDTEFYIVWFCFILGGWKALVCSTEADGRYYEVTFNKDTREAYIDTYLKTHNNSVFVE